MEKDSRFVGNNVLKFRERKCYGGYDQEYDQEDLSELYKMQVKTNQKLDALLSNMYRSDSEQQYRQRIKNLEEENAYMKKKIKNSFPIHIITYLVVCSLVLGVNLSLLILRIAFKVYTIDPYYIICALLIAITLSSTAIAAIKDWKGFLNER